MGRLLFIYMVRLYTHTSKIKISRHKKKIKKIKTSQTVLVVLFTSEASGDLWPALACGPGSLRPGDLRTGGLRRQGRGSNHGHDPCIVVWEVSVSLVRVNNISHIWRVRWQCSDADQDNLSYAEKSYIFRTEHVRHRLEQNRVTWETPSSEHSFPSKSQ